MPSNHGLNNKLWHCSQYTQLYSQTDWVQWDCFIYNCSFSLDFSRTAHLSSQLIEDFPKQRATWARGSDDESKVEDYDLLKLFMNCHLWLSLCKTEGISTAWHLNKHKLQKASERFSRIGENNNHFQTLLLVRIWAIFILGALSDFFLYVRSAIILWEPC
jgi:hypothetical protein